MIGFTPRPPHPDARQRTARLAGVLCMLALSCGAPSALAGPLTTTLDASASLRFDDNHSNSLDSRDREADEVYRMELVQLRPPGRERTDRVTVVAALGLEKFGRLEDLDRVDASVSASLSLLPGAGYGAPSLDIGLRGEARRHRDSSIRDGFLATLFLGSTTRVTDRLAVASTLDLTQRTATSGAVFDTRMARLLTRADLTVSARDLVWFEARGTTGDLTANAGTSSLRLLPQAESLEVDGAFGPGLLNAGPGPGPGPGPGTGDRIAYRLDGESVALEAGWLHALGPETTLEASLGYRRAWADDGVHYDNLTLALFLLHRLR